MFLLLLLLPLTVIFLFFFFNQNKRIWPRNSGSFASLTWLPFHIHICPRTCTHIQVCAWTVITPAFDLFGWQNANVKLQHIVLFRSTLALTVFAKNSIRFSFYSLSRSLHVWAVVFFYASHPFVSPIPFRFSLCLLFPIFYFLSTNEQTSNIAWDSNVNFHISINICTLSIRIHASSSMDYRIWGYRISENSYWCQCIIRMEDECLFVSGITKLATFLRNIKMLCCNAKTEDCAINNLQWNFEMEHASSSILLTVLLEFTSNLQVPFFRTTNFLNFKVVLSKSELFAEHGKQSYDFQRKLWQPVLIRDEMTNA